MQIACSCARRTAILRGLSTSGCCVPQRAASSLAAHARLAGSNGVQMPPCGPEQIDSHTRCCWHTISSVADVCLTHGAVQADVLACSAAHAMMERCVVHNWRQCGFANIIPNLVCCANGLLHPLHAIVTTQAWWQPGKAACLFPVVEIPTCTSLATNRQCLQTALHTRRVLGASLDNTLPSNVVPRSSDIVTSPLEDKAIMTGDATVLKQALHRLERLFRCGVKAG